MRRDGQPEKGEGFGCLPPDESKSRPGENDA